MTVRPVGVLLGVLAYYVSALGAIALINVPWFEKFEKVFSFYAAPALFSLFVWNPVLRPLGMTTRGWWDHPTTGAVAGIVLLYALVAYSVAVGLRRIFR